MILDVLENLPQYLPHAKGFERAVEFLLRSDLDQLEVGRHEIDGERAYALVSKDVGRSRDSARLEAHRRYIDIQVVLAGLDTIGWKSVNQCSDPTGEYVEQRDVRFYSDEPDIWLSVKPGSFVVFFPRDAHLPSISSERIHKIVVKVVVDRL
jgi:biofilm protein TabA